MGASQSSGSSISSANTRNTITSTNSPASMATSSSVADHPRQEMSKPDMTTSDILMTSAPPPQMGKIESFEEKVWRKFSSQPLIPIGCATTAYFLVSGIKSFQKRDPVRSQRMMRNRVMAQFVTIVCFVGYMGLDQFDLRMAPMYQDNRKALQQEQQQAAAASSSSKD